MTSSESIIMGESAKTTSRILLSLVGARTNYSHPRLIKKSNIMSCTPSLGDVLFIQFTSVQFNRLTTQRDSLHQIIARDRRLEQY